MSPYVMVVAVKTVVLYPSLNSRPARSETWRIQISTRKVEPGPRPGLTMLWGSTPIVVAAATGPIIKTQSNIDATSAMHNKVFLLIFSFLLLANIFEKTIPHLILNLLSNNVLFNLTSSKLSNINTNRAFFELKL